MNIKQKYADIKEKVKKIDFKTLVTTKAFITVGCIMLVCIAVVIGSLFDSSNNTVENTGNSVLGNTLLVDAETNLNNTDENADAQGDPEDFFAMAILNRTQVRDSALEVLREIADNPDTLPDAKEEALSSIAAIADDMSAETNIETLIEAKGIAQCVAVISGENCSVIVNTQGLVAEELTQITDIVYEQTGIPVANITVVEAK